ncbi:putative fatty acyl-CoA reductase CG5065 [Helicoverpa armigera]|uniref:putative fatty acyl-CoA reductase CG5065 n=1 Tax=Helicoverpa armigera TaxID=29058 RepID=UPI003083C02B
MFRYIREDPDLETSPSSSYSPVADFYAGKSVFITGITGFLGKVFLEKLLYSCKDIDTIYVLIRDKKGKNAQQRLKEILDKALFSRLRDERPCDFNKIVPVFGDISLQNLGISKEDEETLIQKVSVVFHVAGITKFNEELKVVLNTNVGGTSRVLNLCHRMKNIKVFVHISTAYCNTNVPVLEEKLYPPPAKLTEVYTVLEQAEYNEKQIKGLLNGRPNTYTFTKALAESYVAENHGNIPTVIIRPSIVSAAQSEPIPGWVDNLLGATGLIVAVMKGANRVLYGDEDNFLDLIPVDYVANTAIVAAARCKRSDNVSVYNSCTSSCNPLTIGALINYTKTFTKKDGHNTVHVTVTENKCLLSTLTTLLQTTPAYAMDLLLRAKGKKPKYMKIQSKIVLGRKLLDYYTSHSWEMKADRTRELHASLSAEDRLQFPCDPCHIDWEQYTNVYLKGIEQFILSRYC